MGAAGWAVRRQKGSAGPKPGRLNTAISRSGPPQAGQTVTSTAKTRANSAAQDAVIAHQVKPARWDESGKRAFGEHTFIAATDGAAQAGRTAIDGTYMQVDMRRFVNTPAYRVPTYGD